MMPTLLIFALLALTQTEPPRQTGPVFMIDNDKKIEMQYSVAGKRGAVSGVGVFASTKQYFTFGGPRATLRTTNPNIFFEFSARRDLNASSVIYLIKLETKSDRREIRTSKVKSRSASVGVPDDRKIDSTFEEIGQDETTRRYRLKPVSPLQPGEYCLVRSSDSCFDFGVDKK